MALKFFYGAENSATLSGADYSSGDTTGTNTAGTFDGGAAKTGSYGYSAAASTTTNVSFDASSIWPSAATPASSAGSMGFWHQATSGSPNNGIPFGMRCHGTTTPDAITFMGLTGGLLSLACLRQPNGKVTVDTTASLTAATWYFLVGRWDIANNKMTIEIYTDAGGGSTALVESVEGTGLAMSTTYLPSTAFQTFQVGLHNSAETDPMYSDHFLVSDAYDAPLQNNAFITDYANYSESTIPSFQYQSRLNPLLRM